MSLLPFKTGMTRGARNGFTLIELVAMLALLSILSVSIMARFSTNQDAAESARNLQVQASLQQGVQDVRLLWMLSGRPQGVNVNNGPQVEYDGILVRVDPASGYAVGDGGADNANTMSLEDCVTVFNDTVMHSFSAIRVNLVDINTYRLYDLVVTRTNANPDICNYYWTGSISILPNNANPTNGRGLRYFTGNGDVTVFDFN